MLLNLKNKCFITIELLLWVTIIFIKPKTTINLHYLSIIITFIYIVSMFSFQKKYLLMLYAFSMTLIADLFLTYLDIFQTLGTAFFFMTQFFIYYKQRTDQNIDKTIYIFIFIDLILTLVIYYLLQTIDPLLIISIAYISMLLTNIIYTFLIINKNYFLMIGLIFQLLADIFVALGESSPYIEFNQGILYLLIHLNINMIWLFYIPAQTLIAISVNKDKKEELKCLNN